MNVILNNSLNNLHSYLSVLPRFVLYVRNTGILVLYIYICMCVYAYIYIYIYFEFIKCSMVQSYRRPIILYISSSYKFIVLWISRRIFVYIRVNRSDNYKRHLSKCASKLTLMHGKQIAGGRKRCQAASHVG